MCVRKVEYRYKSYDTINDSYTFDMDYVYLHGNQIKKNTILSAIERMFAGDIGQYKDEQDEVENIVYDAPFGEIRVTLEQYQYGEEVEIESYMNEVEVQRNGLDQNTRCVRWLGSNKIRSFSCSQNPAEHNEVDYTTYSDVLSTSQWSVLLAMYNNIIGREVLKIVDYQLQFDFSDNSEVEQGIYLLLAECLGSKEKVILLASIDGIQKDIGERLLKYLQNIPQIRFVCVSGEGLTCDKYEVVAC
jgi:hypothetical protein